MFMLGVLAYISNILMRLKEKAKLKKTMDIWAKTDKRLGLFKYMNELKKMHEDIKNHNLFGKLIKYFRGGN